MLPICVSPAGYATFRFLRAAPPILGKLRCDRVQHHELSTCIPHSSRWYGTPNPSSSIHALTMLGVPVQDSYRCHIVLCKSLCRFPKLLEFAESPPNYGRPHCCHCCRSSRLRLYAPQASCCHGPEEPPPNCPYYKGHWRQEEEEFQGPQQALVESLARPNLHRRRCRLYPQPPPSPRRLFKPSEFPPRTQYNQLSKKIIDWAFGVPR